MRKQIALLAIISAVSAGRANLDLRDKPPVQTGIADFPAGRMEMRDWTKGGKAGQEAARKHAWKLFSGLVLNRTYPLWEDWSTKCDLKLGSLPCNTQIESASDPGTARPLSQSLLGLKAREHNHDRLLRSLSFPAQLEQKLDLYSKVTTPDLTHQLSAVYFNPEAAEYIRTLKAQELKTGHWLGSSSGTQRPGTNPKLHAPQTVSFPSRSSIAIKTIWELVTSVRGAPTPNVVVWDPSHRDNLFQGTSDTYKPVESWTSFIAIEPNQPCDTRKDYADKIVPLSCFYYIPLTVDEKNKVMNGIPGVARPSQSAAAPGAGGYPYYLILLGFHVATKEIHNWTWQTFYWSTNAFSSDKSDHEGNQATNKGNSMWSHYVVKATLSDSVPEEVDGAPRICFDPYLEGEFPHGAMSNCMTCHRYAVYHTTPREGCGFALHSHDPKYIAAAPKYFTSGVQTDFLWSLADVNGPAKTCNATK